MSLQQESSAIVIGVAPAEIVSDPRGYSTGS